MKWLIWTCLVNLSFAEMTESMFQVVKLSLTSNSAKTGQQKKNKQTNKQTNKKISTLILNFSNLNKVQAVERFLLNFKREYIGMAINCLKLTWSFFKLVTIISSGDPLTCYRLASIFIHFFWLSQSIVR